MGSAGVNADHADPSCHYTNKSQIKPVAVFLVLGWCCAGLGSDIMALRVRRFMARAKGYCSIVVNFMASVGDTLGQSVCDSATTSFTVYLLQAILCTATERTSVRKWLDSAACKSTNSALLSVQLLTVETPSVFNAVMHEVISPVMRRHPTGSKVAVVMSLLIVRMRKRKSCFRT